MLLADRRLAVVKLQLAIWTVLLKVQLGMLGVLDHVELDLLLMLALSFQVARLLVLFEPVPEEVHAAVAALGIVALAALAAA